MSLETWIIVFIIVLINFIMTFIDVRIFLSTTYVQISGALNCLLFDRSYCSYIEAARQQSPMPLKTPKALYTLGHVRLNRIHCHSLTCSASQYKQLDCRRHRTRPFQGACSLSPIFPANSRTPRQRRHWRKWTGRWDRLDLNEKYKNLK